MASTVVNEVCGLLPLGWELQLCMEQGAAWAYNQVSTDEVAYQGDSCFSRVGDPEACLTVLDLVDNLTDVLGRTAGVEVARSYNGVCSDQVRYLGDSLFEPLSSTG